MEKKYYRDWHLAKGDEELRLTELEFAMMRCQEAFARWVRAAEETVGLSELKHSEHVILHVIRMQNRPKSGATIARLINRDDLANIQYSLRKLEAADLIVKEKEKGSKLFAYRITPKGETYTDAYAQLRSDLLIRNIKSIAQFVERSDDAAQLLSMLTGIYEESARNSASFNRADDLTE